MDTDAKERDAGSTGVAPQGVGTDELRVPFWIVLAGVGAGAFWSLTGVVVGYRIGRRCT